MEERLTVNSASGLKLLKGKKHIELLADKELTKKALNRLAEYEDLEEQGLLLRLPCIRKCDTCLQVLYEDKDTKQVTYAAYGLGDILKAEKKLKEIEKEIEFEDRIKLGQSTIIDDD